MKSMALHARQGARRVLAADFCDLRDQDVVRAHRGCEQPPERARHSQFFFPFFGRKKRASWLEFTPADAAFHLNARYGDCGCAKAARNRGTRDTLEARDNLRIHDEGFALVFARILSISVVMGCDGTTWRAIGRWGHSQLVESSAPRPVVRSSSGRPLAHWWSSRRIAQEEVKKARIPMANRDYCVDVLIPLNECRRENYYLPWKCEDERHAYELCQYKLYKMRTQK